MNSGTVISLTCEISTVLCLYTQHLQQGQDYSVKLILTVTVTLCKVRSWVKVKVNCDRDNSTSCLSEYVLCKVKSLVKVRVYRDVTKTKPPW